MKRLSPLWATAATDCYFDIPSTGSSASTGEALADLVDTGSRLAHEARAELEPEEVETDGVKAKNGG